MNKQEVDRFINRQLTRRKIGSETITRSKSEELVDLEELLYSLCTEIESLQNRVTQLENPDWDIP